MMAPLPLTMYASATIAFGGPLWLNIAYPALLGARFKSDGSDTRNCSAPGARLTCAVATRWPAVSKTVSTPVIAMSDTFRRPQWVKYPPHVLHLGFMSVVSSARNEYPPTPPT